MTDTPDGPVLSLFGWCQTHGRPDHYHALCRREYRSTFGVHHKCSCPNHEKEGESNPLV